MSAVVNGEEQNPYGSSDIRIRFGPVGIGVLTVFSHFIPFSNRIQYGRILYGSAVFIPEGIRNKTN